jgi:hypothetical protein
MFKASKGFVVVLISIAGYKSMSGVMQEASEIAIAGSGRHIKKAKVRLIAMDIYKVLWVRSMLLSSGIVGIHKRARKKARQKPTDQSYSGEVARKERSKANTKKRVNHGSRSRCRMKTQTPMTGRSPNGMKVE